MNERIKEMAIRLGYLRWDVDSESYEVHGDVDTLDSFADLIIQECIHAVENTNDRYRREYFAAKIREHFGVE